MNRFYQKNEVGFAVAWIVAYVVLSSMAESVTEAIGIQKLVPMLLHLVMTAVLWLWIRRNSLQEKYGFQKPYYPAGRFLYYIPLILIATTGIWTGFALHDSPAETLFYVISMACVGFLEEVIFRGLLFRAMAKDNVRTAIIVSAVTFGIGHIVNLMNGQALGETLLQIFFAVTVGFVLVILVYRGGSIIPCILFHSLNNCLNAFSPDGDVHLLANIAVIVILGLGYLLYLLRALPEPDSML